MFPEIENRRRGRSKRRFIIPVIVSLVAFAWWVGNTSQDNLSSGAYLEQVRDVSDSQAARASSFQVLYLGVGDKSVDRETLVVTMDQLRSSLDDDIAALEAVDDELPQDAQEVRILINLALQTWRSGLADFQSAATRIPAGDPAAEIDLRAAVARLQVGDAVHKSLVEQVQVLRAANSLGGSPFPEVLYMDSTLGSGDQLDGIVDALRTNPNMNSEQRVTIQFSNTTPALVGDTTSEGLRLLPNTELLDVEVTLSNQGTDVETGLVLVVTLTDGDSQQTQSSVGITLDGSSALSFVGFEVEAGVVFELTAVLTTDAGITIQRNSIEFEVSPPSN
jgi:hypothetical protein